MKGKQQWFMTALTLLLCAALCLSVISLYREGLARRAASGPFAPIFTWQDTAARMACLMPLITLWLAGAFLCRAGHDKRTPHARPEKQRAPAASGKVRFVVFVCAVAFIVLGILNGGLHDVLVKAIQICTECIGLG